MHTIVKTESGQPLFNCIFLLFYVSVGKISLLLCIYGKLRIKYMLMV